jgi:hypothetical protein
MYITKKTAQHTDSLKRNRVQFPTRATDFSVLLNVHASLGEVGVETLIILFNNY